MNPILCGGHNLRPSLLTDHFRLLILPGRQDAPLRYLAYIYQVNLALDGKPIIAETGVARHDERDGKESLPMTKQGSSRFDEKLLSAVDAARSAFGETRTDFFRRPTRQRLRRLRWVKERRRRETAPLTDPMKTRLYSSVGKQCRSATSDCLLKPVGRYVDAGTDTVFNAFSFDSDKGVFKRSRRDSANGIAELEQRARKGIERCAGRTFEDQEWIHMRGKLMEFYAILRGWEEQAAEQRGEKQNS